MKNTENEAKLISAIQSEGGLDLVAIYLFGSFNTAYETTESDADIAVLSKKRFDMNKRLALMDVCARALHKDKIDLIDLLSVSTVLKFQIVMNGRRIYCANSFLSDSFEMYALSDYVRLNEERRDIIAAIQKRGSVF